jgi:hypothetical protein
MIKHKGEVIGFPPRPPGERRAARRQRALKGGVLKFHNDFCVLECVVRNLSENGARLVFGGDTLPVPMRFDLRIGPDGDWRAAQVRWRSATDVGVVFAAA